MKSTLEDLLARKTVTIPQYDLERSHVKTSPGVSVSTPDIVLLEGILVLFDPAVRNMLSMKIFVDEDSDVRLARRGEGALRVFSFFIPMTER